MTLDASQGPLREIIDGATTHGWHICSWASLRASTFPSAGGWAELKTWCAENDLECAICFSQASRTSEVQFRKRHFRRPPVDSPVSPMAPKAAVEPLDRDARRALQVRRKARATARTDQEASVEGSPSQSASVVEVAAKETWAPTIVGIPWYAADEYARVQAVMSDASDLPVDYVAWATAAAELARTLKSQGVEAVRVPIDPEKFVAWCETVRIKPDAQARQGFANEKAFCLHLAQQDA